MAKEPASIFTLNYTPLQVYWVKDTKKQRSRYKRACKHTV